MTAPTPESRLRQFLFGLAAFIYLGTTVELLLEEHTQELLQWLPFLLCLSGFAAALAVLLRPHRPTLLALRGVMSLITLGGFFGMANHLTRNFAFEQEIRPNAVFSDLLLPTLKGAAPLLAPGIMIFAALIALAATYYHPALGHNANG